METAYFELSDGYEFNSEFGKGRELLKIGKTESLYNKFKLNGVYLLYYDEDLGLYKYPIHVTSKYVLFRDINNYDLSKYLIKSLNVLNIHLNNKINIDNNLYKYKIKIKQSININNFSDYYIVNAWISGSLTTIKYSISKNSNSECIELQSDNYDLIFKKELSNLRHILTDGYH